jgi:uncharacterized protein (TIGR01777 family)
MNVHLLALQLMAVQGCLGAFDTLYHHEMTVALPRRPTAALELSIHAVRSLIYSLLFIGLAGWEWRGLWALVLLGVFGIEIILTLWDFVVEDQTRLLPATERVTHTVLAINGGAFIMLLALNTSGWLSQPTELAWAPHGGLSVFLALCGFGVGLSGVRDALAAYKAGSRAGAPPPAIRFSETEQHVLVTGATGFIGQQLVTALLRDGHQVTALTRQPRHAAWLFDGKVRCIASMDDLPVAHRIDVVINLAGARILGWRWTANRKAALRHSRIALTNSVINWIAHASQRPRLFLSASAIGYYGVQAQGDDTLLTEDSAPQPVFMSQLCSEWEIAAHGASAYGVPVACMRFGLVLGVQGALPMMLLPIRLGLGGRLGSGSQWLSWIHVEDVVRAMAHLCLSEDAVGGAYNFTAPDSVSQKQFSKIAAREIGRPCVVPTPAFPMRLALGEQADLLLEGQRVVPARLQADGFTFKHPSLQGALQSLR